MAATSNLERVGITTSSRLSPCIRLRRKRRPSRQYKKGKWPVEMIEYHWCTYSMGKCMKIQTWFFWQARFSETKMKPKSIHIYSPTAKTWRMIISSRGKRMQKGLVLIKYFFVSLLYHNMESFQVHCSKSCIKAFNLSIILHITPRLQFDSPSADWWGRSQPNYLKCRQPF